MHAILRRSVRSTPLHVFLALAFASTACAAARGAALGVGSAPVANVALERALETIAIDDLRSDVYFLAADELGGRDTPSLGLQVAARYIRARLERLGWEHGAKDGYFYTYPLLQKRLDLGACSAKAMLGDRTVALELGSDYFLASARDALDSDVRAEAVWCGAGEDKDFVGDAVKGRWAICVDRGEQGFRIARAAEKAGAVGLAIVEASDAKESYASRYGKMEELRGGAVEYPRGAQANDERSTQRGGTRTPRVYLSRGSLSRLLALAGKKDGELAAGTALGFEFAETRKLDAAGTIQVENVCGFWPGNDPVLKHEVLIVSAHYDHVGTSRGQVYNGADDNASGTAGLLALAEALAQYGPLRRSVMLMWLSGEEKGLWGSKAWNDAPWLPEGAKAVCNVNIDMIGRNAADKLLVTPTAERKEHNGLVRLADSLSALEGFPKLGSADEYYTRSDHYNFAKKGIPAAFLFSDVHEDYHRPTDDPEKLDYDKVRRVTRLVLRMLDGLQGDTLGV